MRVAIYVRPGARQEFVGGQRAGALVVHVKERPVHGAATAAGLGAVARALGVPKRDVTLVHGHNSRRKIIEIPDSASGSFAVLSSSDAES
jgi:uncharacterized protein YggU (UPF0235/DUF167 family)